MLKVSLLQKHLILSRSVSGPPRVPLAASSGVAGQEVEMVDQGAQVKVACAFRSSELTPWLEGIATLPVCLFWSCPVWSIAPVVQQIAHYHLPISIHVLEDHQQAVSTTTGVLFG